MSRYHSTCSPGNPPRTLYERWIPYSLHQRRNWTWRMRDVFLFISMSNSVENDSIPGWMVVTPACCIRRISSLVRSARVS